MKLSDVFKFLSDPDNMSRFICLLDDGMWDEWDTSLLNTEMLGPEELAIAAKSASCVALFHEDQGR